MLSRALAAAFVLGLGTLSVAAIQSSSTQGLSAGTVFQVAGEGFGRKPAVWLEKDGRRIPLKLQSGGTDTALSLKLGSLARRGPGACVLRVKPKGTKIAFTLSGLEIELPAVAQIDPPAGARLTESTLRGAFFGSKKGQVLVDGVPAKVVSWTDTEIRFRVPTGAASGTVFLDVRNQVGLAPRSLFTVN
jgi:hypothetical protein